MVERSKLQDPEDWLVSITGTQRVDFGMSTTSQPNVSHRRKEHSLISQSMDRLNHARTGKL